LEDPNVASNPELDEVPTVNVDQIAVDVNLNTG
jgi:hypothetical protein